MPLPVWAASLDHPATRPGQESRRFRQPSARTFTGRKGSPQIRTLAGFPATPRGRPRPAFALARTPASASCATVRNTTQQKSVPDRAFQQFRAIAIQGVRSGVRSPAAAAGTTPPSATRPHRPRRFSRPRSSTTGTLSFRSRRTTVPPATAREAPADAAGPHRQPHHPIPAPYPRTFPRTGPGTWHDGTRHHTEGWESDAAS